MLRLGFRLLLLTPLLLLPACGGDDDGPATPGDTIPPVVTGSNPDGGSWGIALDAPLAVTFSEDMDPASHAGQVTLSAGTVSGMTWSDARTLVVSHSAWSEAVQVQVTIGTGLKDAAGNGLSSPYVFSFWTMSSGLTLLEAVPAHGTIDVLMNVSPQLIFSRGVDLSSLQDNLTITEPTTKRVVPEWSVEQLESDNRFRVSFAAALTPLTTYRMTVGTGVHTSEGGIYMSAPAIVEFTTGEIVDETPPTIQASSPALGATVGANLASVVITFSEPVLSDFQPTWIAGQFPAYMAGEPQWSPDGTTMTVNMRPPLPLGVRFFVIAAPGTFRDLAGNFNTTTDSLSFTVTGDLDYWPLLSGLVHEYGHERTGTWWNGSSYEPLDGEFVEWTRQENLDGGNFELAKYRDSAMTPGTEEDRQLMRKTGTALQIRGFVDVEGPITFDPVVPYVPFPPPATWSGTSDVNAGTVTVGSLDYQGRLLGTVTVGQDEYSPPLRFERVWMVELYHAIELDGVTAETGTDTLWVAPGIGQIHLQYRLDMMGEHPEWSAGYSTLQMMYLP